MKITEDERKSLIEMTIGLSEFLNQHEFDDVIGVYHSMVDRLKYEERKYYSEKSNGDQMIKNVEVYGLEESIKAAKYPMSVDIDSLNSEVTKGIEKLATSGIGQAHDQFLTGVTVQFDLTATNKFWVEAERYRFLYFVSSQSTMHRITQFNLDEAYNEYVDYRMIEIMKDKVECYNMICAESGSDSEQAKLMYLQILYSNPAGFKLTARMTTNYRQLKTIYAQRRHHKLLEWRNFCEWIETLPMSYFITGVKK